MPLTVGEKLGPYEILAPIGAGGMGEVYRAHDSRLNRDVAIKVSAERFAERFEREARAVAALNHPNICSLYDVGPNYLVMELIEGPTLADRIKEDAIALEEALWIAHQIADALEAAHEKGIVHRDLKPGNIKIKPDGKVKVLDFGLAKMGGTPTAKTEDSPTISMAATQAGVILGTAAYMAPEQARGKQVDKRADIWAFGVVLYEMLTGKRLFHGDDLTDTLAAVLRKEPEWEHVPVKVRRLLRKCLEKDPTKRLRDIGDAWELLEEPAARAKDRSPLLAWAAAAGLAIALGALAAIHFREAAPVERVLHLSVPLPENTTVNYPDLSPDGRRLLLTLFSQGTPMQIYVRSLDSPKLQALPGTAGARTAFWSADSRFIGFFAESKLKVISAAGGPARVLCGETGLGAGGTWSRNGVILFASGTGPLRRVDATGGACIAVGKDDPNNRGVLPTFLPDGDHFFYVRLAPGDVSARGVYLATLGEPVGHRVLEDLSSVIYAPAPEGKGRAHLLFLRDTTLMAQPFDTDKLQPVGDPFIVAEQATITYTPPQVAASVAGGTLVYQAGPSRASQLTWFDRSGKELGKVGPRAEQTRVALSPDGNAVLVGRRDAGDSQASLWQYDLVRGGSESRFTPPGSWGNAPVWSADSRRVLFDMAGPAGHGLYRKDENGGSQAELLLPVGAAAIPMTPSDWSRDGRFLIYTVVDPKTRADIWYMPAPPKPGTKPVMFLGTEAQESQGQLSPDGRWLAYTSDETGKGQVYIRPFPSGEGVWKVSADGGVEPRWRADGKEIFFLSRAIADAVLMAATVAPDAGGLRVEAPRKLFPFRATLYVVQSNIFAYSAHPDGQRFLVNVLADTRESTIKIITNWQKAGAAAEPTNSEIRQ